MIYPQTIFLSELFGHPLHTTEAMFQNLARLARRPITTAEQSRYSAGRVPESLVHKSGTYKFRIRLRM